MIDFKVNLPCFHFLETSVNLLLYRVSKNKLDYLLLLYKFVTVVSKFCISTTKHVSMITYV